MDTKSLSGQVVWITGASSGIGEALAREFARHGCNLVLSARRKEALEGLAAELPAECMVLPLDLEVNSGFDALAAQVMERFGRIDILVNNGGISQRATILDTTPETERRLMEINYYGAVNLARAVLPYMVEAKRGRFIVISSISGKFGFFWRSTYAASKHALHGYFESLRLEYENDGIQVHMVMPGKINTNIAQNAMGKGGEAHGVNDHSLATGMSAEECARLIVKNSLKGKLEFTVGNKETKTVLIKRLAPKMFHRIIRKQSPT